MAWEMKGLRFFMEKHYIFSRKINCFLSLKYFLNLQRELSGFFCLTCTFIQFVVPKCFHFGAAKNTCCLIKPFRYRGLIDCMVFHAICQHYLKYILCASVPVHAFLEFNNTSTLHTILS